MRGTIGLIDDKNPGVRCSGPLRLRDNAWYAVAVDQFGSVFDKPALRRAAGIHFDRLMTFDGYACRLRAAAGRGVPQRGLDDGVALAAAVYHFASVRQDRSLVNASRSILVATARAHAGPRGGYCQRGAVAAGLDRPIDVDCTIEVVRSAASLLQHGTDSTVSRIAEHGARALCEPGIALSRSPDSGILLKDAGMTTDPRDLRVGESSISVTGKARATTRKPARIPAPLSTVEQ
jgi:hypothetical protein